jgi:hypothetical protein
LITQNNPTRATKQHHKQTVYHYFTATAALNASFSTQVTTDNAKMILYDDVTAKCHLH